ncbi:hypothetical protein NQZ68_000211 [Dissostichus eleginoides]|nr:hypothetical protein NQZ68_000211 [Dissostichus eleginoides]
MHGRINASHSPPLQIPANENAQKREGERGREGSPRDTKKSFNLRSCNTTLARVEAQYLENRRHPGVFEKTSLFNSPLPDLS